MIKSFWWITKKDLLATEKRILDAIAALGASDKSLAMMRDELKVTEERLAKAVEQNQTKP